MNNNELEMLADHLGHEKSVHHKYYRLSTENHELAKVSRLLTTIEQGKAHQFKGLPLEDIEFEGKHIVGPYHINVILMINIKMNDNRLNF